ncbi:MAG: hypothetical protein H0X65_18215 [Gemmatimonadetes bacterium]|nr:hypothetical protein [Gemmatimonadota bacterium]
MLCFRGFAVIIFPRALAVLAAVLLLAACATNSPTRFSSDIDELLAEGQAYSRSLGFRDEAKLTDEDVIALGYLERARVGLGSPFRLVAYIRQDARLTEEVRTRLAYSVLRDLLHERGYQVDPAVLHGLRLSGVAQQVPFGEYHLDLIERTIAEAPTALSGERAVRLGYMLARTEGTATGTPASVVSYVASMVADRRRAREDATELLRSAAAAGADPLEQLETWRRELRFRVERPALAGLTPREEIGEARGGAQSAESLRMLAQRLSAPRSRVQVAPGHDFWGGTWLTPEVAERLASLAQTHDYPAQAPVAVAVAINRDGLLGRRGLEEWQRAERKRFVDAAFSEERFVAAASRLRASDAGSGPRLPLIVLQASVFMRGWSQEEPWFPGDPAPSARDLETRFGLADIVFDPSVPDAWRPYYRRMLGRALTDFQRIIPTASVRGLTIRIGDIQPEAAALALHEPRHRVLTLPPSTGAGTIAHEIAHDLDWQLARKRYNRRGSYASDLAVQRRKGDRIAASLAGLAAAFAREPEDGAPTAHDFRPAEVFARGTDWLVAASLAREGRAGGYLTSFQDPALVGYGTTRVPHVDGNAVPALLSLLDQIAPVAAESRQWVLEMHGPSRTLSAKEMARAVTSAGQAGTPYTRFPAIREARDRALEGLSTASCRMTPSEDARQLLAARQGVLRTAVDAAARGVVRSGVRDVAAELEDPPSRRAVDEFLLWRLDGGPEPADSAVHQLLPVIDELLFHADELTSMAPVTGGGFDLNPQQALCGGNPFASPLRSRPLVG